MNCWKGVAYLGVEILSSYTRTRLEEVQAFKIKVKEVTSNAGMQLGGKGPPFDAG